jgi:hypothetical protein
LIQKHHISYDPEITINILKKLHEQFHGHGTGRGQGERIKPKNENFVICAFKLPTRFFKLLEKFRSALLFGNMSDLYRMYIRQGFRNEAPEIFDKFLKGEIL